MNNYYVYILTNKPQGTLYIGVTNNLKRRLFEHINEKGAIFTKKYNLKKLVYAEIFHTIEDAIALEKRLKQWHRSWKIILIEKQNPMWIDLSEKYSCESLMQ